MTGKIAGATEYVRKVTDAAMRKSEPQKASLAEILDSMTTLENNDYSPEEREEIAQGNASAVLYDEWMSPSLAKAILGGKYSDKYKYKLVTQRDCTIVLQIDESIPEDEEPVLDERGNIIKARIVEIPLEEEKDDFQYDWKGFHVPEEDEYSMRNLDEALETPKRRITVWPIVLGVLVVLGILAWVFFMLMLNRVQVLL